MRWILLWGLISLAATCGQKGPLTLPNEFALDVSRSEPSRLPGSQHVGITTEPGVVSPRS